MIKKNLTRGLQFACGVAVVAAAVGATVHTNETKAAASAPSGTCALLLTKPGTSDGVLSITGLVTFNGAYSWDMQDRVNGTNTTITSTGNNTVQGQRASGAYPVAFSGTQDVNGTFAFLPTNNNNTYLVSTLSANETNPFSGVCQVQ